MAFWIASIGMVGLVAGLLLAAVRRSLDEVSGAGAQDLAVYRDQLGEVERDLARGIIGAGEAERLRTEVARRVLEADRSVHSAVLRADAPRWLTLAMAVAVVGVLAGAVLAYLSLGAPGYPDLPRAARLALAEEARISRPLQALAEAEAARLAPAPARPLDPAYAALVAALRAKVAERPDDVHGQALLAQNEAGLGNYAAAAQAQARVVALRGENVTAGEQAMLADLLIMAAAGYVSPEAEVALTEALRRDPANPTARYYSGLMLAQTGRPDLAFRLWRPLLAESAAGDPWVPPIRAQIEEVAMLAGAEFVLPPESGLKGPTAAQMDAAGDMTPEQRMEMIRGMVAGLSERLAGEGGSGAEWARLIGAYGVLGEPDKAAAAWADAQAALMDRPEDLAAAQAAAAQAGLVRAGASE